MTENTPKAFDPSRFLTLVSGKEYLEVKWRLVWLRSEQPDAVIDTELVSHANNAAVFKAYVKIPDGGSATGYGSEDAQGFGDYLEKAETKAIGRALSALGFGTQFAYDHDYGSASGRVVDAPVALSSRQGPPQRDSGPSYDRPGPSSDLAATERQRSLIQTLAREQKISSQALDDIARERTGQAYAEITRKDASTLIEHLREALPAARA